MGGVHGPRRLGASIHQRMSWLWRGYKSSDITIGVQVAVGWACLLGVYASSASWGRLSELGASPTLVFILYAGLCQTVTGATNIGVVLASLAAALTSALAFIPVSLAFAAGGGTGGTNTTAKAIVMVASAAVLAGLLGVARMRFQVLDLFFYYVTYLTSTIAFIFYWQPTPFGLEALPAIQGSMGYSFLLTVALAIAVVIPVTWLLPLPAGRLVRKVTCGSLSSLGRLTAEVVELAVTPSQPGRPNEAEVAGSGTEGALGAKLDTDLDAELAANAQQELVALHQYLQKLPLLLLATRVELDLFATQKRFPSQAFSAITDRIDAAAACLGMALRPLARAAAPQGELLGVHLPPVLPVDLTACRAAAVQFRGAQQALTVCCEALAGVLGQGAPMAKALERLQELEDSAAELSKAIHDEGGAYRSALSLRTLFGMLRAVGLQVRSMYRPAAEAVEQLQPGAVALVDAHFKSSLWARIIQPDQSATEQQEDQQALLAAAAAQASQESEAAASSSAPLRSCSEEAAQPATAGDAALVLDIAGSAPPAAAAEVPGRERAAGKPAGKPALAPVSPVDSFEPLVDRPCSEAAGGPRSWLSRAGLGQPQLRPGLQLALGMAVAGTLVVVFKVFESLDFKSAWIVMTVNAVFERCVGNIRLKSFNRFLGTAFGMTWACACIGFSYLANGSSWDNSPAKYATMACMVTLWGFFIGANRNRSPRYSYSWSVMSSTVCVVVLEGFKDERTPWKYAAYRLACVSIGLAIDILVSSFVLPVTVEQIQRQELQGGLEGLAVLVEQVAEVHAGRVALGSEEERAAAAKKVKATQKKVRTAALRMGKLEENARLELDKWWPAGPSGSSGGDGSSGECAPARHLAVKAVRSYLLQLRDLFTAVADVQLALAATHIRPFTTSKYLQLSLAVAEQVAESVRALMLVLAGALPMAHALRTLDALDTLLSQLTAEAAANLKQEELAFIHEQATTGPGKAHSKGALALCSGRRRPAFMFAAAGLGSARLLRRLYHAAAVAMLPTDTVAIQAAEESLRAQADAPRAEAKAAVEQAGVVAALSMHAQEEVGEEEEVGLEVKGQEAA